MGIVARTSIVPTPSAYLVQCPGLSWTQPDTRRQAAKKSNQTKSGSFDTSTNVELSGADAAKSAWNSPSGPRWRIEVAMPAERAQIFRLLVAENLAPEFAV